MPGLRDILEAATPGPWTFNDSTDPRGHKGEFRAPSPFNGFMLVGPWTNDADARLIALAPELAAWALEMGDLLTGILHDLDNGDDPGRGQKNAGRALLARLDQLGKEQT